MRKIFLSAFLFLLGGCGFSPLYKQPDGQLITNETAYIEVKPILGVAGFKLYEALENKLNPYKQKKETKYILTITMEKLVDNDQIIQEDDFSSRAKMYLIGKYSLVDKKGKPLLSSANIVSGTYNILKQPYATYSAAQKMEDDLNLMLSDAIFLRIVAYFKALEVGDVDYQKLKVQPK